MYFWNTKKLIDDLKYDRLTEENFRNYYLASSILLILALFLIEISPESSMFLSVITLIINIVVLFIAMILIFRANGGNDGKSFLNRVISLTLPISIKLFLLYLVLGVGIYIIIGLTYGATYLDEAQPLLLDCMDIVMNFLFVSCVYWRIYVAIKEINL